MHLYGDGLAAAFTQCCIVYYMGAAILHYVLPVLLPRPSVQKGHPKQGQVLKESIMSIGALLVKALVLTAVEKLHAAGYGKLYTGSIHSVSDVTYAVTTIVILDCLHDTWFYWTHRLLHWKPLYRHIHYIHHKSTVPTPFAGYSFHVVEALIVFANEIIVCFLFPIHASLHRIYHLFTTLIHIGGHAGYEMAPLIPSVEQALSWLVQGPRPCGALNTVKHHDMHHQIPTVHFALYFVHWDRLCGTEHPAYRGYARKLAAQGQEKS
ncbi:ERG5 [Auxenochlorella protothecoides x Auxenochlorella symbiontica]